MVGGFEGIFGIGWLEGWMVFRNCMVEGLEGIFGIQDGWKDGWYLRIVWQKGWKELIIGWLDGIQDGLMVG